MIQNWPDRSTIFIETMNDYEAAEDGSVKESVALEAMLMFAQQAETISLRRL